MVEKQESKSGAGEKSKSYDFKFRCCNFEDMAQMMKKFYGGEDGSFDCCAMMQKMCAPNREEPDQQ